MRTFAALWLGTRKRGRDAPPDTETEPVVSSRLFLVLMALAVGAPVVADAAPAHRTSRPTRTATATAPAHPTGPVAALTQGAVAIVNDTVISDYDLEQRVKLFYLTSGVRPSAENEALVREQVLRTLEDETLEVKEAAAHGITVSKDEVDQALNGIATDNRTSLAAIEQQFNNAGVSIGTFRSQIMAQIAWNKTVQGRFSGRLDVRDEEVNAAIDRVKQGSDKPQFRVAEIYFAIDKPEDEAKIRANAEKILAQINGGAPFMEVARQFSQAPSAANGGDIGWVEEGQLSDELDKAIKTLRRGQVAGPIRGVGGFYLLMLRARLEPVGTVVPVVAKGPPTGPVPLARFLLPLPPNAPAEYRTKAMEFATNISKNVQSCPQLQQIAAQTHTVYMSLGVINPKTLSAEVQAALAQTDPGGIAAPFVSQAGIEVIARCEPRPDPIETRTIPTPDQMREQLFQQRVGMLARSYLRDLRRDAVIETR